MQDEIYEPFKYPGLKVTMGALLNDGIQGRVLDGGDRLTHKGRKYAYKESDFLEAYLGKDFMRAPRLEDDEYHQAFGVQ